MTRPFVLRLSTGQMRGSEQGPVGRPPHQFGGHRGWSRTCVVLPMSTWFFPAWPGRAGCWAGCGAPLPQLCQRKLQLADVLLKNFAFTLAVRSTVPTPSIWGGVGRMLIAHTAASFLHSRATCSKEHIIKVGAVRNGDKQQCMDKMGQRAGGKAGVYFCHGQGGNQVSPLYHHPTRPTMN